MVGPWKIAHRSGEHIRRWSRSGQRLGEKQGT